jgi:hypothetical protein
VDLAAAVGPPIRLVLLVSVTVGTRKIVLSFRA